MTAPQTSPVQRLRYLNQTYEERNAVLRTLETEVREELRGLETKVRGKIRKLETELQTRAKTSRKLSTSKAQGEVDEAKDELSRYLDKIRKQYNKGVTTGDVILDYVFGVLPDECYSKTMKLYADVEGVQNELNKYRQWVAVVPKDEWPGDILSSSGRTFRVGKTVDNGPVLISGKVVGELCVNTDKKHIEYIDTEWGKKHPKVVKDDIQLFPETEIEILNLRAALDNIGGEETHKMLGLCDEQYFEFAPEQNVVKRLTL